MRGRDEASYRTDVTELLKWVGLGERMHVLPPVLSGGEKQRAAIARALIEQPEILLADEPTGNVDPPLARRLLRLFIELNRLGTAVVIATHDLGLMEQVDARRMILDAAEGSTSMTDADRAAGQRRRRAAMTASRAAPAAHARRRSCRRRTSPAARWCSSSPS